MQQHENPKNLIRQHQDNDFLDSRQHQIDPLVIGQKKISQQTQQQDLNSIRSVLIQEQQHPDAKSKNNSQLSSQGSILTQIRKLMRQLYKARRQESDHSFRQLFDRIFRKILELTGQYASETEQLQQLFDTPSMDLLNKVIFQNQRNSDLVAMQNQMLRQKIRELQLKLAQYTNHTKAYQDKCKILTEKYEKYKKGFVKATRRIGCLERKQLSQKEEIEALCAHYRTNTQILKEKIQFAISDEVRKITEEYQENMLNIKHIFQDHQSGISLAKQSEIAIPSPESYKLVKDLVNSSKIIGQRLKAIQRQFQQQKIKSLCHYDGKQAGCEDDGQKLQPCQEAQNDDQFEQNYKRALENHSEHSS